MDDRMKWKLLSGAAAVAAAGLVRYGLNRGWRSVAGTAPPGHPERTRRASWPAATGWTLAVAAGAGLARMLGRKGAAVAWRARTGKPPG